jgi:LysR family nitrogen assimilation transcriptional regulator
MELRQLRYLIAIAEEHSISKASARVFVAQSALSHQLAQLEAELGVRLLHRSSRGVELTDAGNAFLAHAQAILRQVEDARRSVEELSSSPKGAVALGIPQSVSNAFALPLIKACTEHLPRVRLELTEELTGNLVDQLRRAQLHLAVLFDDGSLAEFSHKRIVRERLALIHAPGLKQSPGTGAVNLRTALQQRLILPAHRHGVRPQIERAARDHGVMELKVEAEINSIGILRSALLAELGSTILPTAPLGEQIQRGQLVARPIVRPALTRTLAVCAPKRVPISEAARAVSRLVVIISRQLCASGQWMDATAIYGDNAHLAPS